ncbi:MAG: hypothetical protein GY796_32240 [Chloroflexi bacterium]|nr:hypothetical protein [Chloroflexota bacterium]
MDYQQYTLNNHYMRFLTISSREWLTAVILAILTAVFLSLPYFLGANSAPEDQVYMHLIMNPEDSLTYWAKMAQGLDGAWDYTIPFTPEVHEGAYVGVFYVWLGQVARLTGWSLTAVWHLSRFVAAVILFITVFVFTAVFLSRKLSRWTAYLLALYGSGLGWLLFLSGQTYWLGAFPVDFKQPGAHLFFTAMTFPHIILGTALILLDMLVLKAIGDWRLEINGNLQSPISKLPQRKLGFLVIMAGVGNILLGIAYPFLIYIVAITAILLYLYLLFKARRMLWTQGFMMAVLFLIPAPLYLYYLFVWQTNDVFRIWEKQAGTPAAPWPHYLISFGVMLLLTFGYWWRRPSNRFHFSVLWCWLAAVLLLLYAPLGPQRRFVQGVHVALAMLTAVSLVEMVIPRLQRTNTWKKIVARPRYTTQKLSRFLVALFLLFMSLSNLFLWADVMRVAGLTQPDLFFRPTAEMEAAAWLRENTPPTAVVLGAYETGNLVAAYAGNRVMLGHWAETVDYDEKETAVAQFFNPQTTSSQQQALLEQFDISYIWVGPREMALGGFEIDTAVAILVYANDTITIYETPPDINITNN